MTRYNPRNLLPNARANQNASFGTKGNSEVFFWKPDNRIPDTTRYWRTKFLADTVGDLGFYATNGSNLYAFASHGQAPNAKYITSPSYGSATDSWTVRSTPNTNGGLTGFWFINSTWYYCSFGNNGSTDGYVYTSSDAITWTLRRTQSYGGFIGGAAWYNPGLSRYESCVIATGFGNPSALSSTDNGATWTSTSGGWSAGTSCSFIKQAEPNMFLMGTVAGGLWYVYFAPSSTITSVAASPLGSVALTSYAKVSHNMGQTFHFLATNSNVLAVQLNSYASSWTVINSPAASGDYIVDLRGKNSGISLTLLLASTKQGKIYAGAVAGTGNIIWQDVSPAPLNSQGDATSPSYKFLLNGANFTDDIGTMPTNISFPGVNVGMTTSASRNLITTTNF